jgi:hypothetical protein
VSRGRRGGGGGGEEKMKGRSDVTGLLLLCALFTVREHGNAILC